MDANADGNADGNAHTCAEHFDADGNYHAILDGHAVTIPYSAIADDGGRCSLHAHGAAGPTARGSDGGAGG